MTAIDDAKALITAQIATGAPGRITAPILRDAILALADACADIAHGHDATYYLKAEVDARTARNQPNGYAALDADGRIAPGVLPALGINDIFEVASQAAMLALVAQRGDVVVRTDVSKSFILAADDATVLANWKELLSPTAGVISVAGLIGVISAAALKAALALATSDITGLDAALAARGLKAGETWTGPHDFGGAAVTGPRALTVGGSAVPVVSPRRSSRLGADFTTASTAAVEAFLGPEWARYFSAPGEDALVHARFEGEIRADRATSTCGIAYTLQYRVKTAGSWGAWAAVSSHTTDRKLDAIAGGGTSSRVTAFCACEDTFTLPTTATDYQLRLMVRNTVTGSSPSCVVFAGGRVTAAEEAI